MYENWTPNWLIKLSNEYWTGKEDIKNKHLLLPFTIQLLPDLTQDACVAKYNVITMMVSSLLRILVLLSYAVEVQGFILTYSGGMFLMYTMNGFIRIKWKEKKPFDMLWFALHIFLTIRQCITTAFNQYSSLSIQQCVKTAVIKQCIKKTHNYQKSIFSIQNIINAALFQNSSSSIEHSIYTSVYR